MVGLVGRRLPVANSTRPCPVCTAQSLVDGAADAHEPRPVRCAACDLVFIDPLPAGTTEPDTYGDSYYEPWSRPAEERARVALWRRRLRLVEKRAPVGTLLDVGCGDGLFLEIARAEGWSAEGIEFSPSGARRASERLGRPIAIGDLAREGLLRDPFGVVTLWHVLEHLPDASSMLNAVLRRLAPDGVLVVAVPNIDNLFLRGAYRLARLRPLPLYETGAREPHLSHFDTATLSATLKRCGFRDIEIVPDRCALTLAKRGIDAAAALASRLTSRLLTNALVAFARAPR